MYCGTNPIALLNQRQLAQALFRLMEQKPFSAISVSELCRAASIMFSVPCMLFAQ